MHPRRGFHRAILATTTAITPHLKVATHNNQNNYQHIESTTRTPLGTELYLDIGSHFHFPVAHTFSPSIEAPRACTMSRLERTLTTTGPQGYNYWPMAAASASAQPNKPGKYTSAPAAPQPAAWPTDRTTQQQPRHTGLHTPYTAHIHAPAARSPTHLHTLAVPPHKHNHSRSPITHAGTGKAESQGQSNGPTENQGASHKHSASAGTAPLCIQHPTPPRSPSPPPRTKMELDGLPTYLPAMTPHPLVGAFYTIRNLKT